MSITPITSILELVMIVKNSGEVLRKCLKSVKPYIDHWTILDTGSIDNTKDIIDNVSIKIKETLDGFDKKSWKLESFDKHVRI